jgi:CBS domain-containing protein
MTGPNRGDDRTVRRYMAELVARVSPDATLAEVADKLLAAEIGALAVGTVDRVQAIITERDLARALAQGWDPTRSKAGDVATENLIWCGAGESVEAATKLMLDAGVRHLLVGTPQAMAGILSARDLLRAHAG